MIPREGVWEWLGALNDIRLGLAGELDLSDQSDAQRVERNGHERADGRARADGRRDLHADHLVAGLTARSCE